MSSIDRRVVEAQFDNRQFEQGVKTTLGSLDRLNKGLAMPGATNGLSQVAAATGRVTNGLNVMRVAAYTAIATIAHQATIAGEQFVKSFTVGPLLDGLHEYETQLGSIQTILSNTQWQHTTLKDVNAALAQLNHYSDKTIYNFSEMARNIGTFTAAGVKLDTSVNAIKGIANLAAVSGSNAQQASTAMYQLSQALSSGTVKLMDWNSVVNAGMGGKVFQDALTETARVHGVAIDKMIKKDDSFRNTLQEGWLTSKILTETLAKFTGDESKEQLKQQGYTEKQIASIQKLGKMATDAATKVKTGSQLINTLQETAGSGWAKTWQIVIGNFNEAKDLWTGVNNTVGGALTNMAKARNKVLSEWKDLGGRDAMLAGIKSAFEALMSVIKPIKDAFREIFPAKTGQQLYDMTVAVRDFMENLKIGAATAENLKRTFAGVFAVLDIGWQVIKAGIKFIADLFGAITEGEGSGGFLGATANIGDFLVALDSAIKKGEGLTKFFQGLEHILAGPIELLKAVASAIFGIFDFNAPGAEQITNAFEPVASLGTELTRIWDKVVSVLDSVWSFARKVGSTVADLFYGLGQSISDAVGGINYEDVLHTINTGLFAGLLVIFKQFTNKIGSGFGETSGIISAIKAPFEQLTGTLSQMQKTLRATTLLQIAAAIGIMTASVIGLSGIDAAGLTRALTAMSVMFGQLFASTIIFEKIGGVTGITGMATGLILFATAIRLLTSSVKALSELSWEGIAKGLTGVTVLIGALTVAVKGMSGFTGGMIRAGAGLILLSAGIRILATSVTALSGLNWSEMARGLTGVGALLVALTLFAKFSQASVAGLAQGAGLILLATGIRILANATQSFASNNWGGIAKGLVSIGAILAMFAAFSKGVGNPITLIASGAALVLVSGAMVVLAKAVAKFGALSWGEIGRGLVTMAGALSLIAVALNFLPPQSLLSAAAILVVASSLGMIAKAMEKMGGLSWSEIAHGMVTLAGALGIIAIAMMAMTGALPGAAATLVVAAAMRILAPVLQTFGSMSWTEIAKGLVTLAGAFAVIGLAGVVLTPLTGTLLALGLAIALIGGGIALAGAGILALSIALTALAAAGTAGTVAIVGLVSGLLGLLPQVGKSLALMLVSFTVVISKAGPAIVKALVTILDSLAKAIIKEAPVIIHALDVLLTNMLKEIVKAVPQIADASLKMIVGVLHAVADNAPKIVNEIARMLVGIINAIANKTDDLVAAGINVVVHILEGIARKVDDVIRAGVHVALKFMDGIAKAVPKLVRGAINAVVDMLNGLADAIRGGEPKLMTAFFNVGKAIIDGFIKGIQDNAPSLGDVMKGIAKTAILGPFGAALSIMSPSKKFAEFGMWSVLGYMKGWQEYAPNATKAVTDTANNIVEQFNKMSHEFKRAGRYATNDFAEGLVGGEQDVLDTWNQMMSRIADAVERSGQAIKDYKDRLDELRKARDQDNKAMDKAEAAQSKALDKLDKLNEALKKNRALLAETKNKDKRSEIQDKIDQEEQAIKDEQKIVEQSQRAYDKATEARQRHNDAIDRTIERLQRARYENKLSNDAFNKITSDLYDEKQMLKQLGEQYDEYTAKIKAANDALNEAIATRDNYAKSIADQYTQFPEITEDTSVEDYINSLKDDVLSEQEFALYLQGLRDMGLNDELYQEFLSKGPAILPFIKELFASGQTAVDTLNALSDQMVSTATALGTTAANSLYQAGVDAAQGLLDGLVSKQDEIADEMTKLGHMIAKAIKDALKIKSPSKVLAEVGGYSIDGLADGMWKSTPELKRVAAEVGKTGVAALRESISKMQDVLVLDTDLSPRITPVLDLSRVQKDAAQIADILGSRSVSVDSTYSAAKNAAVGYQTNALAKLSESLSVPEDSAPGDLTLVQNNYSPKALSAATIYRQTKNQLSQAKGALAKQ